MVPLKAPGERAMTLFHASLIAPRWAAGPSIILDVPGKKGREEAKVLVPELCDTSGSTSRTGSTEDRLRGSVARERFEQSGSPQTQ